jgi:hypothetical protein
MNDYTLMRPGQVYDPSRERQRNARVEEVIRQNNINATTFTATGAGAIARTVHDKQQETVSVKDFGAVGDGVTDDAAAIQAAVAYASSLGTLYGGGAVKVKIPSGIYFLNSVDPANSNALIDITNADNVLIEGDGDGVTTILGNLDKSIFRADRTAASPLFRFGIRDLTIEGLGSSYTSNHAIWLAGGNNCFFENVRIWKARTGIRYQTCFHTEFINLRMNGQGGLALYDGLYAADGEVAVAENAVGVYGGRIQGCVRYGWRGECITGSCVFGLEILGCGSVGLYLGESPSGKDLKWFTWVGGLVDTCPDLITVKKGTSTVAELIQFSGMWLGYASDTLAGAGVGVEFIGIKNSCFSADIIANTMYAANIQDCERISFSAGTIWDYDRLNAGAVALICNNTTKSRFDVGTTKKLTGSPSTTAFVEQGTSNYNLVTGTFDGAVTTIGAASNKTLVVLT